MIRNAQIAAILLLLLGLAITFMPEKSQHTQESRFLSLALECHKDFRSGVEAAMLGSFNIFKLEEVCTSSADEISVEVRSGTTHVLRSHKHGYEISFSPQLVTGEVEWTCETNVYGVAPESARAYCKYWRLLPYNGQSQVSP